MSEKKIVKRDYFEDLKDYVASTNFSTEKISNAEFIKFIDHELELLNRKRTGKSAKDVENAAIAEKIRNGIMEVVTANRKPLSIDDMQALNTELDGFSNQKMTHQLTALKKEGLINRKEIRRKAHYFIANLTEEEIEKAEGAN